MDGQQGAAAQRAFHQRIGERNLAALWVGRIGVDLTRPAGEGVPALWHYDALRPDITEAGEIITAEEAFRRVLVLENPAWRGEMRITNTLYAGLQLVLPGEIAPCHRHSQAALRFVIEGTGAYTSVDGERTRLHPGDLVITPAWSWHDHGNDGDAPVVWLDVLDTPLVGFFDSVFRETYRDLQYPLSRPDDSAVARFGAGLAPLDEGPAEAASPVFNYGYERARAALETLRRDGAPDACHGLKMRYVHPQTGGHITPTMGCFLQHLPAGFDGADYRSTDGMVYCVVEGRGRTVFDDETVEWGERDLFVVPGWRRHRLQADTDAILFSASDRPAQRALALWREERFDRND